MTMYPIVAATSVFALVVAGGGALAAADAGQNGRARGRAVTRAGQDQADRRGTQMQARFRAMDTDGDGVVTRNEFRGTDAAFRQEDANGDGVLSGTEVQAATTAPVSAPIVDPTRADVLNARFSRLDVNNDGRLVRGEWTAAAAGFDRADTDHDGSVTRSEYLNTGRVQAPRTQPVLRADERENTPGYRAGYDKGLIEGRQAGKDDRAAPAGTWDLEGQRELEQADSGFDPSRGAREDYQAGYRAGFRLGYSQGFGPR
jgi:EF hand domain-containing protein